MKKITIYSGDPCPYCNAAKALLKTKNSQRKQSQIEINQITSKTSQSLAKTVSKITEIDKDKPLISSSYT